MGLVKSGRCKVTELNSHEWKPFSIHTGGGDCLGWVQFGGGVDMPQRGGLVGWIGPLKQQHRN